MIELTDEHKTHTQSNNKNKLQEFIQGLSGNKPLPSYQSTFVGTVHIPGWSSVVTLYDGTSYKGHVFPNKTSSELSAAYVALQTITQTISQVNKNQSNSRKEELSTIEIIPRNSNIQNNISSKNKKPIKLNGKTSLLVDIENLHKFVDQLLEEYDVLNNDNLSVYVFVNKHHHSLNKVNNYPDKIKKIICPIMRADGSDIYMQIYTGILIEKKIYQYFIIASRDKFGGTLVDIINNVEGFTCKAYLVVEPSQINEIKY
jgi:Double-stranded RNA binding motif